MAAAYGDSPALLTQAGVAFGAYRAARLQPAAPCQLTDPDDLNVEAVQLLQKLEQVSCDGPLDAAADLARALALGSPASRIDAGGRIITQPDQGHGMQL